MKEIDKILRDQKKFTKVNLKDGTTLNFAVNQEKHVDKDSQETCWVNSMTEKKILKTYRWQTRIMYGLCKVHKASVENCPPFRPLFPTNLWNS